MFNTTITKYYTANGLDKLIQDIEKNSIGMEDWFHRVGSLHETSTNYPPYNLIKESSTEFTLEIALAGYKKEDIEYLIQYNKFRSLGISIYGFMPKYTHILSIVIIVCNIILPTVISFVISGLSFN